MTSPAIYRKSEIAFILKVPTRTVQFWVDKGIVLPDIANTGKSGSPLLFSEKALIEVCMLKELQDICLVSLGRIAEILRVLRDGRYKKSGGSLVVFDDFYTNSAWGDRKELIALFEGIANPSHFIVIDKNRYGFFNKQDLGVFASWIQHRNEFQTLMLGKVKNWAKKRSGVK